MRRARLGGAAAAMLALGGAARGQAVVYEVEAAPAFAAGSVAGVPRLAACGDVDGDGVADFVAGAPDDDLAAAGRVVVWSGKDGSPLWEVVGSAGDRLGAAVDAAGDLDGDGFADVLIGAPGADPVSAPPDAGLARGFGGGAGGVLLSCPGSDAGGQFGAIVAGGSDLDGDGFADPVAGGAFATRAWSGKTGLVRMDLPAAGSGVDRRLAALSDFDGDGRDDLAVALPNAWIRVLSGATGLVVYALDATENTLALGQAIADAGDLDGDGRTDLLVGATGCLPHCQTPGRVLVIAGGTHDLLLAVDGPSYEGGFGARVAASGDVDQDGVPDFAVGAPRDAESGTDCGRVTVVSGADGGTWFTVLGDAAESGLGRELAGLGDVDADGVPDLVVGTTPGASSASFARVLSGGRPDVHIGGTIVGDLLPPALGKDVDEVHLHGVAGARLAIEAAVTGGALKPRVTLFGPDGALLAELDFPGPGAGGAQNGKKKKAVQKVKLTQDGLHRLRVEGREGDLATVAGDYSVATHAVFQKKSGSFTAKRTGHAGEVMEVVFHALPGAVLEARIVKKKGYGASPPNVQLRSPSGAVLGLGPYVALDEEGAVHLAGVPLEELGAYAIEVFAAASGTSKVKVHVELDQPLAEGVFPVP